MDVKGIVFETLGLLLTIEPDGIAEKITTRTVLREKENNDDTNALNLSDFELVELELLLGESIGIAISDITMNAKTVGELIKNIEAQLAGVQNKNEDEDESAEESAQE